jgi:hypothetical protein
MPATGIQKLRCDSTSHQSTPATSPRTNAIPLIGRVTIAAMIAKKTASKGTVNRRTIGERERGSTVVGSRLSRVVPTMSTRPSDRSNAVNSR